MSVTHALFYLFPIVVSRAVVPHASEGILDTCSMARTTQNEGGDPQSDSVVSMVE